LEVIDWKEVAAEIGSRKWVTGSNCSANGTVGRVAGNRRKERVKGEIKRS
jgi:hypothetical protein